MKRLILFVILLADFFYIKAQTPVPYSENPAELIKQIETLLTATKRDVLEDIYKAFQKKYAEGVFTEPEIKRIAQTCNTFQAQKFTTDPYYADYFRTLTQLNVYAGNKSVFNTWHTLLDSVLANIQNRQFQPLKDYLDFSTGFFEKKAIRYSETGVSWYAYSNDFSLEYEVQGPVVKWNDADLICKRKADSIAIRKTSGKILITKNLWVGKGGIVPWDKYEKLKDVYAELNDYEIELIKGLYEAKDAVLIYPEVFPGQKIKGLLQDKLNLGNEAIESSYPRFLSEATVLDIRNIGPGISCLGGFKLNGTTVYSFGDAENKSVISIYKDNRLALRAASENFSIKREERVVADKVSIALFFGNDSIVHPSVNFRFDIPTQELHLTKGSRAGDKVPFFDSYHQVTLDVDKLDWYLKNDTIIFNEKKLASAVTVSDKSVIESVNYFQTEDYRKIQNISTFNPLDKMMRYSEQMESRVLDANALAKQFNVNMDATSIQNLLFDLASRGFLNYDFDKQSVTLFDKLFHYVNASSEKEDYDDIKLISISPKLENAFFPLKDSVITINGLSNVEFSSKQKVGLKPLGDKIQLKKNRNMTFNGRLFAGRTVFYGNYFNFDYNEFTIKMDSALSLDLYLPTGELDKKLLPITFVVKSSIEKVKGILLIDAPNNKSSKEDIALFPSINTKGFSYVFYDNKKIHQGCYNRDSFYFQLDRFSLNALDSLTVGDLKFKGTMVSSYIFPDFKETITLQRDTSLGFISKTPEQGYPTYMGKGNYKGSVALSNQGFYGGGTLKYLGSVLDSDTILYKPKEMLCNTRNFFLAEDRGAIQFPEVNGSGITVDWLPYIDSMYLTSGITPFDIYKSGLHHFKGRLALSPGGLSGKGELDWDKGTVNANFMQFGAFSVKADTMNLQVKALNSSDQIALDTRNIKGEIDFDKQTGNFKANAEFVTSALPYNQYMTSMNEFDWDMRNQTITFKSPPGKFAVFTSTDPMRDSLTFTGKTAFYDLKTNDLNIGGIPYIQTCDAFIYTETGDVHIKPGGAMDTLLNAKIICDTSNQYHVINRATVDLQGRKFYTAEGFYEYNIGNKLQEIKFDNIIGQRVGKGQMSEKKTVTRATGEVKEETGFYIDHKTLFQGTISLNAESKNLQFDGYAKLEADKLPNPGWFSVHSEADKNNLIIAFDEPKNPNGDPLRTGLYISKEVGIVYPRVMMPLFLRKDRVLMDTRGVFKYNKQPDEFVFGDSAKIVGGAKNGNKMVFQNANAGIIAEGIINLGNNLKYIKATTAGRIRTEFLPMASVDQALDTVTMAPIIPEAKVSIDAMTGIEMNFPDKLLKYIVADIYSNQFNKNEIDYNREDWFEKALAELIPDEKDWSKVVTDMKSKALEIPAKYNKFGILFSKLPLKWDTEYGSFVNRDMNLGIQSIANTPVNEYIKGYIEFKMPSNEDDRLYIYLKMSNENFYFFGYQQGVLSVTSNNEKFNDEVLAMKEKDRIFKMGDEDIYEIQYVEPTTAESFVARAQAAMSRK